MSAAVASSSGSRANSRKTQTGYLLFASYWLGCQMPHRPNNVHSRFLVPAGKKMGLEFSFGWHTFRHSYKTWLDERKIPLTVQRDLMRHADSRTTAQVYGSVATERIRSANSKIVTMVFETQKKRRSGL